MRNRRNATLTIDVVYCVIALCKLCIEKQPQVVKLPRFFFLNKLKLPFLWFGLLSLQYIYQISICIHTKLL